MYISQEVPFQPGGELLVETSGRRIVLAYSDVHDAPPRSVELRADNASAVLRMVGAASGAASSWQALFQHVDAGFEGIELPATVIMSGGLRGINDDATIRNTLAVPRLIRTRHRQCLALGTAPRLKEKARLMGMHGTFLPIETLESQTLLTNPDVDMVWFVRTHPNQQHGTTLEIEPCFDHLDFMRECNMPTGLWAWGGGKSVTNEIIETLMREHPCALVEGSGGITGAVCDWLGGRHMPTQPRLCRLLKKILDSGANLDNATILPSPDDTRNWLISIGIAHEI